jgi:hypothetical protein
VPAVKKAITVRLDSKLLRKVQRIAAEEGISIREFLVGKFQEIVRERKSYARARKRALSRFRKGANPGSARPSSRDESHER